MADGAVFVDPTTKLRIRNPLVELALLKKNIVARNVKPLSQLAAKPPAADAEVDT
jgi:hypothetical protein